jgi:hypothetical protein
MGDAGERSAMGDPIAAVRSPTIQHLSSSATGVPMSDQTFVISQKQLAGCCGRGPDGEP